MNESPEVRVVLEVDDVASFAQLLGDVLGLREIARFGELDQQAVVLEAGRATIELGNRAHIEHIDDLEAGTASTRVVRLALAVDDAEQATRDLSRSEELSVVAGPRPMPWGSVNARLESTDGLQITLFEQREPERF